MKPISLIVITAAIVALGVVVYFIVRKPAVKADLHELNKDVQRGARDAYNGTKDAAEDAKDKVKDAVK